MACPNCGGGNDCCSYGDESRGAAKERAAVVAWLRAMAFNGTGIDGITDTLDEAADAIEAGEHQREGAKEKP